MATKNLTGLTISRLKYTDKAVTFWDTNLTGFGIRVGKRTKTFVVMVGKNRRVITVCGYSDGGKLKDVRTRAKRLMLQTTRKFKFKVDDAQKEFLDSCKKAFETRYSPTVQILPGFNER